MLRASTNICQVGCSFLRVLSPDGLCQCVISLRLGCHFDLVVQIPLYSLSSKPCCFVLKILARVHRFTITPSSTCFSARPLAPDTTEVLSTWTIRRRFDLQLRQDEATECRKLGVLSIWKSRRQDIQVTSRTISHHGLLHHQPHNRGGTRQDDCGHSRSLHTA